MLKLEVWDYLFSFFTFLSLLNIAGRVVTIRRCFAGALTSAVCICYL